MNDDQTAPIRTTPDPSAGQPGTPAAASAEQPAAPAPEPAAHEPVAARRRWRDRAARLRGRTLGLRGAAAVALAGLLLGGAAGALVHAAVDDGRHGDRPDHSTVRDDTDRGERGPHGGPPPGGAPEVTPPQEEVQPDAGTDRSSGDAT